MLWNVYVIDEDEITKVNTEPYDVEQVAFVIERLDSKSVILQPANLCVLEVDSYA